MCRHTREPTVLSRLSCRPSHLNFDRFHQPCLLPGRAPCCHRNTADCWAGIGEDCRPRTTWQPLTIAGSTVFPPVRLTGGFCHADWTVPRQEVNSSPSSVPPRDKRVLAHTQVRDPHESATACSAHALGTPSPWPRSFIPGFLTTAELCSNWCLSLLT